MRRRAGWARSMPSMSPEPRAAGHDRLARGRAGAQIAAASAARGRRHRLRGRSADVDLLRPARGRRAHPAADPPGGARGRACAVWLCHRAGARAVSQSAEGLGRRPAHRAGDTLGGHARRPSRRPCASEDAADADAHSRRGPQDRRAADRRDARSARDGRCCRRRPAGVGAGRRAPGAEAEAYSALVALGYKPVEATRLLKAVGSDERQR